MVELNDKSHAERCVEMKNKPNIVVIIFFI